MINATEAHAGLLAGIVGAALLGTTATGAHAQTPPAAPPPSTSSSAASDSTFGAPDPSPYYIGASQALTHDSNVYRVPGGRSDNYSSTSLLGGFDQPISRQRVFGRASVTANRYQDETQLNNVSYDLSTGLNWETIEKLSGSVNLGLNRNLAAPPASTGRPTARRNIAQTESVDLLARYGGAGLLTVEGRVGYRNLDYSAPEYVQSESKQSSASLGLYYRPGGPMRLGIAGRADRTRTPKALFDPATGNYQSNTLNGKHVDFLADYDLTGLLTANGRLSYTRQTNSGRQQADFSGVTGSIGVSWRPTGKTAFRFDAARDAGFDSSVYQAAVPGTTAQNPTVVTSLYENNRVTTSVGMGVTYAATAKISTHAGVRYIRAKLTTVTTAQTSTPETTDVAKTAYLGANYEITRNWSLACNLSHESRDVSGGVEFAYRVRTIGCLTQFIWR
jgi:hypothetical protein